MNTPVTRRRRLARLRAHLLGWYRVHRRDLPWRTLRDPYAIWVSEVMLQQTRVDTVIPYWTRFLEKWPDVDALASADAEDVRAAWSGLGYYRRASTLHEAARVVVRDFGGVLPSTCRELATLPGFGRYTAGAVASIAFGEQAPIVDGNVARVLSRIEGLRAPPPSVLWSIASEIVRGEDPGDLNQAMMELGATLCTPRNPACTRCPVARMCAARRAGTIDAFSVRVRKPERRVVRLTMLVALHRGTAVILEKRPEKGLFAGLYCPPLFDDHLDADDVADRMRTEYGWSRTKGEPVGTFRHALTHRTLDALVVRADRVPSSVRSPLVLAEIDELGKHGIPTFGRRAIAIALEGDRINSHAMRGQTRRKAASSRP